MREVSTISQCDEEGSYAQCFEPDYFSFRIVLALNAICHYGADFKEGVDATADPATRVLVWPKCLWQTYREQDSKLLLHCKDDVHLLFLYMCSVQRCKQWVDRFVRRCWLDIWLDDFRRVAVGRRWKRVVTTWNVCGRVRADNSSRGGGRTSGHCERMVRDGGGRRKRCKTRGIAIRRVASSNSDWIDFASINASISLCFRRPWPQRRKGKFFVLQVNSLTHYHQE